MADRIPHRVRVFLREELPRWRAEGILDEAGAETLRRRYLAEPESTGVALAALHVLAACLIGAGIISLVASNWNELARGLRLAILGVALVAAHGVGFWMWQIRGRHARLGHAVSLLGTVIFGASIGLVAQLFHVSGPWYGMFGAWALGALTAGLVLPSLPALGLATILGLFVWGPGFVVDHASIADAVAWLAGGGAVALAFRARSRALFVLATTGLGVVLGTAAVALTVVELGEMAHLFAALLGITASTCAFAGVRFRGEPHRFSVAAGVLGRIALYVLAYWLSFAEGARSVLRELGWGRGWVTCGLAPLLLALALAAFARTATAWIAAGFVVLYAVLVQAGVEAAWLVLAAHAAILGLAGVRIAEGLRSHRRAPFWEGLAVAAVVACSRFLEIDTKLWLKGLLFIACGIAVTVAALVFERRLSAPARPSSFDSGPASRGLRSGGSGRAETKGTEVGHA